MDKVDLTARFLGKHQCISALRVVRDRFSHKAFFRHDGYEVMAIYEGECWEQVENKRYRLEKGDLLFVAEGEHHAMSVPRHCEIGFLDIRPDRIFSHPELLSLFLQPFQRGLSGGAHKISGRPALFKLTRELIALVQSGKADIYRTTAALIRWVGPFRNMARAASGRTQRYRDLLKPALDLIFESYAEPITAADLSKACAMSKMTFYRRFQAVYHKNPKEFLNDVRMGRVLDKLTVTDEKISRIALEAGFFNLSNFSRIFRRKCGQSPFAFRKSRQTK